ncbi:nitroreductase family protein [Gorillibacterium massiliense]|uniref:nitroreductase family protein n=1 Tax=Gorillibacterium massiliense TaxID=1280390 RepID=UPI0004B07BD2|nr:nitroreductase family protein [Gorillibacterium massiliense]
MSAFLEAVKKRRSYYNISRTSTLPDDKIAEIVKDAVKYTPSSFNCQSSRAVLLLGSHHDKLWSITTETLRKIVPADNFASTEQKMKAFGAGYGTVLFFEDQTVVEKLMTDFALYKDNFPVWSEQTSGMLQLVVWTALTEAGLGATLQHYNPLIDNEVKATWKIPDSWKLTAQMPFGKPEAEPGEKAFQPIEERVKIHK